MNKVLQQINLSLNSPFNLLFLSMTKQFTNKIHIIEGMPQYSMKDKHLNYCGDKEILNFLTHVNPEKDFKATVKTRKYAPKVSKVNRKFT